MNIEKNTIIDVLVIRGEVDVKYAYEVLLGYSKGHFLIEFVHFPHLTASSFKCRY
jgi:hypothetical protein